MVVRPAEADTEMLKGYRELHGQPSVVEVREGAGDTFEVMLKPGARTTGLVVVADSVALRGLTYGETEFGLGNFDLPWQKRVTVESVDYSTDSDGELQCRVVLGDYPPRDPENFNISYGQ